MGLLDMFDSPDILNLILGGAPNAGAPPSASPQPGNPTGAPPMNPPTPQVNPWQTATAALGRGLATVGGNTAGGAFARGMGGAIIGGQASQNQQEQQVRQAKNDLFNQSSIAFRDMMLARQQDDMEAYRQAQGNYLNARANMARLGGTGSNAWQAATPYGRMIQVENEVQKYEKGQQVILQKQWGLNGSTPDQQQKDLDALQQKSDAYRQRLYKAAGISTDQANQMKDMGTSPDKPFETKGMTLDQFNSDVPMGGWYRDQNGVARQRTVPPGGMQNMGQPQQPTQAAQPQNDTGTYTADMAANTPAPTEAYGQQ